MLLNMLDCEIDERPYLCREVATRGIHELESGGPTHDAFEYSLHFALGELLANEAHWNNGNAQPLVSTEMLPQHAVLLPKVLDDLELSSVDPSTDSQQEKIQSGYFSHRRSLPGSWAPIALLPNSRDQSVCLDRIFGQHGLPDALPHG